MLLRNNKNESVTEMNQDSSDVNNASGYYNSINNLNGIPFNFKDYNSTISISCDDKTHDNINRLNQFSYTDPSNPSAINNISPQQNHNSNIQISNMTNFPPVNVADSTNSKPMSPASYQQYYNMKSSSSVMYPNEMNSMINQSVAIQQNIVSTTTIISASNITQPYQGMYSNYVSPSSGNNSTNMSGSNCTSNSNISHFNRSSSHMGLMPNLPNSFQQNTMLETTPNYNQLSHSFSNLTMNRSPQTSPWNVNEFIKGNETFHQPGNNHSPNSYQFVQNTSQNNDVVQYSPNNEFTHLPNLNASSRSLPQTCLQPNTFQHKDLINVPTSISISTPAVVPGRSNSSVCNRNNNTNQLVPPLHNKPANSFSGYNQNDLTPSRRMINVVEERLLIPPTGILNPIPNLMHITKKPNCSSSIMRSTMNSVPCNDDILGKTRLPLAILIHPFKDLANLQVIRSKKIVRCRTLSCRAYLNPFVIFSDQKRWKCNLCQRINELTDDFLFDESLGIYIETQKRAEVRLATVEYIAPKEYSIKNSQVPVYIFMVDISQNATCALYPNLMNRILGTIDELLDRLPGHQLAKFALIGYDSHIHLYPINEKKCQEVILSDISAPVEIPITTGILVDIHTYKEQIQELLTALLDNVDNDTSYCPTVVPNCLGSALLLAKQLLNNFTGRITIFNASCPTIGEGILTPRDAKKSTNVFPLSPEKEFYKSLSLECAQAQIGVDLFQLGKSPCDLASLSIVSRFCGGSLFYYPDLAISSPTTEKENLQDDKCILEVQRLLYDLNRYLTRKIGFDAVLRVRHSSGLNIQSSHGNFFARACDLYAMSNINPDSGIAIRLGISDTLIDNNVVFFQAALLYTSSLGERRIRVHTLCLPVSSQIDDVFRMADHQAIAGLLAKSVSDRLQTNGKVLDAREALINAVVDPSSAFGEFCLSSAQRLTSLPFPYHLRLLPLYVWGILQSKCLLSINNDPDASVANLDSWRNMPLSYLLVDLYPSLFNLISLAFLSCKQKQRFNAMMENVDNTDSCSIVDDATSNPDENPYSSESEASSWDSEACSGISCYDSKCANPCGDHENMRRSESVIESDEDDLWFPEQLHLTIQSLTRSGVYLLESSHGLILLMGSDTPRVFFNQIFGVDSFSELPTNGSIQLPEFSNAASIQLRVFIKELQIDRPLGSHLFVISNMHSQLNSIFQSHLLEDDKLDTSYHRFLKHIQRKINK